MFDNLQSLPGVGEATARKLCTAGFTTAEAIAVTPLRELMQRTAIGEDTARKIVEAARKVVSLGYVTAAELMERRKGMLRCTTGSKALDVLLAGGIETRAMTELIGQYGTGKTQICKTLTIMAQLPREQGGLDGDALFMDTEGTFIPERVYQIASKRGLDPNEALKRIIVSRAYTSDHQSLLIDHLPKVCGQENIKLVVVDSMISHFRGEYVGRETLSERQQKLNQSLHKLIRLADAFDLAVVVTNQVQSNPAQFFGDPNRPAGGNIMAHACTHRIMLRKGKQGTRVARVIDSPSLPESKAYFLITEKGIEDIPGNDNGSTSQD